MARSDGPDDHQLLDAWAERACADPESTAVLTDFDGTLAEIRLDPQAVVPLAGAIDALGALGERFQHVAVISGRPVAFLVSVLPPAIHLSGLYGLEEVRNGGRIGHHEAERWRSAVGEAVARARRDGPAGMEVEAKGLSATLHYRGVPEIRPEVERFAALLGAETGLIARSARFSVELHPPIEMDKGTVVRSLAAGAKRVCYLGDDVGDLPAFSALAQLRQSGVDTLSIAAGSPELAPEVRDAADATVDGPAGAVEFLHRLAFGTD